MDFNQIFPTSWNQPSAIVRYAALPTIVTTAAFLGGCGCERHADIESLMQMSLDDLGALIEANQDNPTAVAMIFLARAYKTFPCGEITFELEADPERGILLGKIVDKTAGDYDLCLASLDSVYAHWDQVPVLVQGDLSQLYYQLGENSYRRMDSARAKTAFHRSRTGFERIQSEFEAASIGEGARTLEEYSVQHDCGHTPVEHAESFLEGIILYLDEMDPTPAQPSRTLDFDV